MERESDAVKEELGLGGWQPAAGQDIITSTTTTTTTTTISTVGTGLSTSEHYNGAQFLAAEEGKGRPKRNTLNWKELQQPPLTLPT
jgi:hypothetical protein